MSLKTVCIPKPPQNAEGPQSYRMRNHLLVRYFRARVIAMIDKSWDDLTTKEKFRLQRIEKSVARGQALDAEEQAIYDRFYERYAQELKAAHARWPIIIALLIGALLALLRKCS